MEMKIIEMEKEVFMKILRALEAKPNKEFLEYVLQLNKQEIINAYVHTHYNLIHKPTIGCKYYYIVNDPFNSIECNTWINSSKDYAMWHMGNCFYTVEDAEKNKEKILKLLNSVIPLWISIKE